MPYCPSCGRPVGNTESICPECGYAIPGISNAASAETSPDTEPHFLLIGKNIYTFITVTTIASVIILLLFIDHGDKTLSWSLYAAAALFLGGLVMITPVYLKDRFNIFLTFTSGTFVSLLAMDLVDGHVSWSVFKALPIILVTFVYISGLLFLSPEKRRLSGRIALGIFYTMVYLVCLELVINIFILDTSTLEWSLRSSIGLLPADIFFFLVSKFLPVSTVEKIKKFFHF